MPGLARQPCEQQQPQQHQQQQQQQLQQAAFRTAVDQASWPQIVEFGAQTQRFTWPEPFARATFAAAPAASLAALLNMPLRQFVARSKRSSSTAIANELVRQAYWLLVWRRVVGRVKLQT